MLSNAISGFFDHQYLWKETVNVLHFLDRDSNPGKTVCKTTTAGRMWPGMPSHAHACLVLAWANLVGLRLVRPQQN